MSDNQLDDMERSAHASLRLLREEYERAARPYIEILTNIAAMRPRIYYMKDGEMMIPFDSTPAARRGEG